MRIMRYLAILTLVTAAQGASAQSVSAGYPDSIMAALDGMGHAPEMVTDDYGDPMINAEVDGTFYSILFYGCEDGRNCQDIQFRASFTPDSTTTREILHDFARDWFVGKTYFGSDDSAIIEHPVVGVDGMPRATFERTMDKWVRSLNTFKENIY